MKRHTETPDELVSLIQKAIDGGEIDHVEKHQYIEAITERANELRVAGDTDAQAFTKAILSDEPCKLLYKRMKSAQGPRLRRAMRSRPTWRRRSQKRRARRTRACIRWLWTINARTRD